MYSDTMNTLDITDKVTILLAALQERYEALRAIRSRVEGLGLWVLGLLLSAAAWIVQSDIIIPKDDKTAYIVALTVAFVILRFKYLRDLSKGFKSQLRVAVNIETALKLYEPGFFDGGKKSIYPNEWAEAGTRIGGGQFFKSTYYLLYVGFGFLAFAILAARTFQPFFF